MRFHRGKVLFRGCNVNRNDYRFNGANFSIGGSWTKSGGEYCSDDADDKLQKLFYDSFSFELNDKELTLYDENGDKLLTLEATK